MFGGVSDAESTSRRIVDKPVIDSLSDGPAGGPALSEVFAEFPAADVECSKRWSDHVDITLGPGPAILVRRRVNPGHPHRRGAPDLRQVGESGEEVLQQGINTEKQEPFVTLCLDLISPDKRFDKLYLSNYAQIHIIDVLSRIPGVGQVNKIDC